VVAEPGSSLALAVADEEGSLALAVAEEEGSRLFVSAGRGTGLTALGPGLLPLDEEKLCENMTHYPGYSKERRKYLEEVGKEKDHRIIFRQYYYGSFHLNKSIDSPSLYLSKEHTELTLLLHLICRRQSSPASKSWSPRNPRSGPCSSV
jgi:hypothetical protein